MPFDPVSFVEALKALRKQPQPTPTPQPTQPTQVITQPKYIVYQDGDKYCAQNGFTDAVEVCDSDATTVINYALSNLTPGRTWKETVVLRGSFTLSDSIVVYSYTRLVIMGSISLPSGWTWPEPAILNYAATYSAPQGTTDTDIEIIGGVINGCGMSEESPCAYGIWMGHVNNFKVTGVTISNFSYTAIWTGDGSNGIISENRVSSVGIAGIYAGGNNKYVLNNIVEANNDQADGIAVSIGDSNITIEGNTVSGGYDGIHVEGDPRYGIAKYITILNNRVFSNYNGIDVGYSNNVIIAENTVLNNSNNGINIQGVSNAIVIGNTVLDNGNAGIYIAEAGRWPFATYSQGILVIGNTVGDDRSQPQQKYGIQPYADDSLVIGNRVFGNTVAQIDAVTYPYSTLYVYNNVGFITEDFGWVRLPAGSTSVNVQTNLNVPIESVVITPWGQPPGKLWADIGSDERSFTINTDTPPSSDLTIYYMVKGARRWGAPIL